MQTYDAVNLAFSKQASQFDSIDRENLILKDLRAQIYAHVQKYMLVKKSILELNAGTGLDALHFISLGHTVHATDLSNGMITELEKKQKASGAGDRFTVQQISYTHLSKINGQYDYVFSNFGGLNCIPDLSIVTKEMTRLVKPNGYVTWVIMPRICLWELMGVIKGSKKAFRRLTKGGVMAHVEGEYFRTWYHSLASIKNAFGQQFNLIQCEGLAAISPPPYRDSFPTAYPKIYKGLRKIDSYARNSFPFNRWADHIIVTFQLK